MEMKRLEDLCEKYGIAMAIHMAESPVAFMAAVHIAASVKNILAVEFHSADHPEWFKLAKGLPDKLIKDGFVEVPSAPGLGIDDIDEKTVKKYMHKELCGFFEDTSEWNSEWANDREMASATKTDPFKLMAVSVEQHYEQEMYTTMDDSAYVMLCGSVEFMNSKYITSNVYGNSDFMLSALQMSGREPVPVGLDYKKFANYEIESITTEAATQYTLVLSLVPVFIALCAGIFVIVRRKNR